MKTLLKLAALACLLLYVRPLVSQLQQPVAPINLILDADTAISVDDVGDQAVMWALVNRGEIKVLAIVCSSANDFSAPAMRAIANYYGHPEFPIGAHQGSTPNLESSATSKYAQQITNQFGTPGDTRANYPDAVIVYRQALAGAPDNSVYIVANGYYEPLQGLLQSPPDSISSLTGAQLVTQKVVRLIMGAGFFPSGNEHNLRVDADAASFVFANWPVEVVSVGVEESQDVFTGPSSTSDPTKDPVAAAWQLFNGGSTVPGFGQLPLLFAARGLGANFAATGLNGQTFVNSFAQSPPGSNNWTQTPNKRESYLTKTATAATLEAILNPLLQSSSNMPILRSISPASLQAGSSGQTITLTGTNFFADSQVQFNGGRRPTTFISGTQLSVQLSAGDLSVAGQESLNVVNAEGGGWTSNTLNLTITPGTLLTPTLTAISPASAVVGTGPVALTATGTNFTGTSVVQVNGVNLSTIFVSSAQLTATIPASTVAAAGSLSVTVATPGGGTSASRTFTINNPAPSLTSLSPTSTLAGSGAFTLTVNGSNFINNSVVQVNGASRNTTFVSSTQLTVAIPASDVASSGTVSITVVNPAPGGGASAAFTLTINNPLPSLSNISPASSSAGSAGFTLTLNGSNFVSNSAVRVNSSNRNTTFVSSTQLTAAVPAADVASAGTISITVVNPAPGGGTSVALTLTINNPLPSVSNISPASVSVGSAAFTLTLTGSGFIAGSVVRVNGATRSTTFVSGTQLTAAIPATDVASAGTLSVSVANPSPGGGTSATLTLAVNNSGPNPQPTLSGLSPDSVIAGSGAFTLTLNGTNFVPASVVQVNGSNRTTTFISSTRLTAAIPASDVAAASFPSISVLNPAPGGGIWSLTFAVNNPQPTLSGLSPDSVIAGSGTLTLTLNGTNFIPASVVQVNGSNRTTTFVGSTRITAAIPASDVASASFPSISVLNPGPGGGVYALTFAVNNPQPTLSSLSPDSVIAGSGALTLTLNGTNFIPASVVQMNGSNRTTTFVSSTRLTAAMPAGDVASASFPSISVLNPGPGGGVYALTFAVNNPQPTLSNLSPASVTAGSGAFTLTLNGTNFIPASVVQVNGSNRTTTFVSSTRLTATIPASDVASAAALSVSVVNPGPGGGVWAINLPVQ